MMNYYNNIIKYICTRLYKLYGLVVGINTDDSRNIRFITNTKQSQSINIYRITDQSELDYYVNNIGQELIA